MLAHTASSLRIPEVRECSGAAAVAGRSKSLASDPASGAHHVDDKPPPLAVKKGPVVVGCTMIDMHVSTEIDDQFRVSLQQPLTSLPPPTSLVQSYTVRPIGRQRLVD